MKALILDLNGIVMLSEKLSIRFAKDFGVTEEVFIPELIRILTEGRKPEALPLFSYWKPVLEKWGVHMQEEDFWEYWFGAEILNQRLLDYVLTLKNLGVKTFILSNNFKERALYYKKYSWVQTYFDKVYFSFETGFVKPDPQAFKFLLVENNLKGEECLYFDDQQKNVEAAKSLGIEAHLFETTDDFIRCLNQKLQYGK